MEIKSQLEILVAALKDFDEHAAPGDKKDAIPHLQRLAKKLEIRSLELQLQRWQLTSAEIAGDKETLSALHEFSQHQEIVEWSSEILNLKRQLRTLPFQTLQI